MLIAKLDFPYIIPPAIKASVFGKTGTDTPETFVMRCKKTTC